jgi:hypothetical protein
MKENDCLAVGFLKKSKVHLLDVDFSCPRCNARALLLVIYNIDHNVVVPSEIILSKFSDEFHIISDFHNGARKYNFFKTFGKF